MGCPFLLQVPSQPRDQIHVSYITGRFFASEPPVDPLKQLSPTSLAPRISFMEDSFSTDGGWEDGFRMIQVHFIYYALYSYCYYISSTSDYQALDTRGGGSLPYSTTQISIRIYETHWIFLRKSKKVLAFWPGNVTELGKIRGYRFHGHGQNLLEGIWIFIVLGIYKLWEISLNFQRRASQILSGSLAEILFWGKIGGKVPWW